VQEILQKVPDVPEVVQQVVVEGAEGNPFYAEELVKMLIEDGAIVTGRRSGTSSWSGWRRFGCRRP